MWFYSADSMITYIIIVLPAVFFAMWASHNVNSTYKKYAKVATNCGLTADQVVRRILDSNGLQNVAIERIAGELTDHYDPKANVIRLSDSVYGNRSAAAIGVAAHEAGHAVQHAVGYFPIKVRMAIIPVCNIGSTLAMPLVLLGIILSNYALANVGIFAFALATVFQLVTLPVEFNASHRAIRALRAGGYLSEEELRGAKNVLDAAALTYVASAISALLQLMRLLLIARRNDRD